MDAAARSWWERELAGCAFGPAPAQADREDGRRNRGKPAPGLPDWANTKAAYYFFSNDRVSEAADPGRALPGDARDRFAATEGLILVVQDTTEFTFQREHAEAIGITYCVNSG